MLFMHNNRHLPLVYTYFAAVNYAACIVKFFKYYRYSSRNIS